MRQDRYQAIQLRRLGKSFNEISSKLGIPKSTLHYWFKDNPWSQEIKTQLINKSRIQAVSQLQAMAAANKKKWDEWHQSCREDAIKQFPSFEQNTLFVAGLMLYWGEGDKVLKNGLVRLSNSDPEIIKVFYLFLLKTLKVTKERIFIKLILYPDLDMKYCKSTWSKLLGISLNQFKNTVIIQGRHPTRRLSLGICSIEVSSRELKEKIFEWIKLYTHSLSI